jgi:hypothetical protein
MPLRGSRKDTLHGRILFDNTETSQRWKEVIAWIVTIVRVPEALVELAQTVRALIQLAKDVPGSASSARLLLYRSPGMVRSLIYQFTW